jgi:vacuolar protein-sorting-associated protein 4
MSSWARGFVSSADGAEEFIWLLGQCLFKYGSVITTGMYQHIKHPLLAESSQLQVLDAPMFEQSSMSGGQSRESATQSAQLRSAQPVPQQPLRPSSSSPRPSQTHISSKPSRSDSLRQPEPATKRIKYGSPGQRSTANPELDEHELHLRETIHGMRIDLDDAESVLEFGDIAGLEEVKLALEEFACFFLHFPHLTRNLRQRSTTGILLFGPQGTGKTLLVRSFARRYGLTLYDIRASAVMSKFVGESEKFIRTLFSEVRSHAPAILLLDECDGLLCDPTADAMQSHHYRLLQNELKNQWSDLIHSRDEVIVVGATNKPHDIDMDGFGRRLSLKLHVDLPGAAACRAILQAAMNRLRHRLEEDDFTTLGVLCHEKSLSGYDIDVLVEALLRRAIRNISVATHFTRIPWKDGHIIVACAENAAGAMKGPWTEVASDDVELISYHPFGFGDMEGAIYKAKPTVDQAMRQKHANFAHQYSPD